MKDRDKRNTNDLLLAHPTIVGFTDEPVHGESGFRGGHCDIKNFFVAHKLPEPIRGHDENEVLAPIVECVVEKFGL